MGALNFSFEIELKEYERLCRFLYQTTGIRLGDKKQSLVESRLIKRLQELEISSFSDYLKYFEANQKFEIKYLIEAMTTHKTEWFRESVHFDFLKSKILEMQVRPLHIWSAACSTGEELWTLAMILNEQGFLPKDYRLLGTDISGEVVELAQRALYASRGEQAPPFSETTKYFFKMRRDMAPPMLEVKQEFRA